MKKLLLFFMSTVSSIMAQQKPSIVIIYADDLGYGDVRCYNPERSKIPTPHMDALAAGGMRFTDAHSSSAVCTPSRYTILTGRYHWRTRLKSGVLNGMSKPLIAPERLTIADLAQQQGYATACIGKWHLGMIMPKPITQGSIKEGPITCGFDYFFGISASLDMPPYAFIENDRFTESPTATKTALLARRGPAAPSFESVDVLPMFLKKSEEWITAKKDQPFLLYLSLTSPHTPLAPTKEWKGESGLGDYADFVMQTDAHVGDVMKVLKGLGIIDNTLVILSSDNGCAPYIGTKVSDNPRDSHERMGAVADLEAKGHYPSGPLRGYKSDAWEGGHRVPFIAHWPKIVGKGLVCDQLVSQADLMATVAEIVGAEVPDNAGEDSFSFMPLLKGNKTAVRKHLISTSLFGLPSVRVGPWQYLPSPHSGGWSNRFNKDPDQSQPVQLYNLTDDIGGKTNLAEQHPERVNEMRGLLKKLTAEGRSTPGPTLKK